MYLDDVILQGKAMKRNLKKILPRLCEVADGLTIKDVSCQWKAYLDDVILQGKAMKKTQQEFEEDSFTSL